MKTYLPCTLCLLLAVVPCWSGSSFPALERLLGNLQNADRGRCRPRNWLRYKIDVDIRLKVCKWTPGYVPKFTRRQSFQIKRLFPGVFLSYNQYKRLTRRRSKFSVLSSYLQHDGDMCCPTIESPPINETKLENVLGQEKIIAHLPLLDMYQFVIYGSCLHPECSTGVGKCFVENTTQFLLVWNPTNPYLSFDAFHLPTYCSCKNI